jgi:hypothetical protein
MATAGYYPAAQGAVYLDENGYPHVSNIAYPAHMYAPSGGVIYTDAQGYPVGPDDGPPPVLHGSFAPAHELGPYDEDGIRVDGGYPGAYAGSYMQGGNRMIARPASPTNRCARFCSE